MHKLIGIFLFFCISITASAGLLPQESREELIQTAFANFWGKVTLSNGNFVQPDSEADRSTIPISTPTANHVISVGELSGIAQWCDMDWQAHFLSLTAKARQQGLSDKQVAFIALLHGVAQGTVYSTLKSKPCAAEEKSMAETVLETSPVEQAIPQ